MRRGGRGTLAPARRLLGALGLCGALACGDHQAAKDAAATPREETRAEAASAERSPCAASPAARALACPDAPPLPGEARARLLAADSPAAVAALLAEPGALAEPDLRGIARLVALDRPAAPLAEAELAAALEDPRAVAVTPVDDRVLAILLRAGALRFDRLATYTARIKAAALLARTHNEALLQLGLTDAPLPPLGRVLAGRFLHYGREFVGLQRRRRVPGLDDLADVIERRLLEVQRAVEATPYAGDDAMLTATRPEIRGYLQRAPVRARLVGGDDPAGDPDVALAPWTAEVVRLIDLGFVDQAIDLAVAYARRCGLDPAETYLLGALQVAGREDGRRRTVERFGELRSQDSPPPREGSEPLPPVPPPAWPSAAEIGAPLLDRLADRRTPRRVALADALLALRERPDVALWILAELAPKAPGSTQSRRSELVAELDWILPEVEAMAPLRGQALRLAVAAQRIRTPAAGDASERALRRSFALAAQETQARDDAKAAEQLLANRPRALDLEGETDTDADGATASASP
ncbi:MAG: hypothetical protein R3A79_11590 [Nannocystaceae bacterium]